MRGLKHHDRRRLEQYNESWEFLCRRATSTQWGLPFFYIWVPDPSWKQPTWLNRLYLIGSYFCMGKQNITPRNITLCTSVFAKVSGKQFKTFVISVAHVLLLILQSCTAIYFFFIVISNGEDGHVWRPFRETSLLAVGEVTHEVKVKPIRFTLLSEILWIVALHFGVIMLQLRRMSYL